MADVTLTIAGTNYVVSCRDGEEDRLKQLGEMVDAKTKAATEAVGENLSGARIILFAALLLADELDEIGENALSAEALASLELIADKAVVLGEQLAPAPNDT
jgi:cell division protein ZapA